MNTLIGQLHTFSCPSPEQILLILYKGEQELGPVQAKFSFQLFNLVKFIVGHPKAHMPFLWVSLIWHKQC